MNDTSKHQGMRRRLVMELKSKGILNEKVLNAILKIPRHLFMDSGFLDHAYEDKAFPIAAGQTISQPYTVAYQTELLNIAAGDKVLEIGTGSGYQTAILLEMGAQVYTIERHAVLFKKAKIFLPKIGYKPKKMVLGDGYQGLPTEAPFKGILVTAGASDLPEVLLGQLALGGRLVIPLGTSHQVMTVFTRKGDKEFEKQEYDTFRFVPLVPDIAKLS